MSNWLENGKKERKERSIFLTESDNQWNLLLEPVLFNVFIQEKKHLIAKEPALQLMELLCVAGTAIPLQTWRSKFWVTV